MRTLRTAALVAALLLPLAAPAVETLPQHPRRLEYRVAWNGIPAADAAIAITPRELAGRPGLEVEATARTNAFVDVFWPFRGTAKSTFIGDELTPLHFVYERSMRNTPYLTQVDFDAPAQRARSVYTRGQRRREFAVDGREVLDPITAVFRARLSGAGAGDVLRYEIFTGESSYRVELTVIGPDTVEVPAGRFAALRIVPAVWKIGRDAQLDPRLRGATIWVADDPLRTLLRIRSEVFVGAVTLDLVKVDA